MNMNHLVFKPKHHSGRIYLFNRKLKWMDLLVAGLGSFIGIGICAFLTKNIHLAMLAPSFGASAVLLYAAPKVALAQPRNVIFGHMVSAFVGICCHHIFGAGWFGIAVGVTLAILAMMTTDTLHPPGGATALVAVINQSPWAFIFMPIGLGAVILVLVALLTNRYSEDHRYPNIY